VLAEKYRLQGVVRTGFDGMEVDLVGGKFNLTDVNAAIGLGQFAHIEAITARRAALARRYFAAMRAADIESFGVELPVEDFSRTNWHMFQIVLPLDRLKVDRAGFMAGLKALGIGAGVHYPPIHLFKLYRELGWGPGMFPVAERIGRAIVTLPMFAAMEDSDVDRVVNAVRQLCLQHQA
jgi:dTDP-4-amino-4,6-dideoxygalactose transaminase